MVWNREEKHYDFTDAELTSSVKRNVFKLLKIPELCKLINARRIKRTKYGYSIKSYWEQISRYSAQNQLNKIVEKCKELDIPYSNATVVQSGSNKDLWSWWIQIFPSKEERLKYSERLPKKFSSNSTEDKKVTVFDK